MNTIYLYCAENLVHKYDWEINKYILQLALKHTNISHLIKIIENSTI